MSERRHVSAQPSQMAGRAILRRSCACGAKTASNMGVCPECERKKLQPKLIVGSVRDPEEHEADRVASAVMREPGPSARSGISAMVSMLQRASAQSSASRVDAGPAAPPIVDRVVASSGQPLDPGARRFFEKRFARDFGTVRVHADARAAASARAVDAHAYTVGNHIVFGSSRYAPDTAAGRHLLAHELTHVVQQGATLRRESVSPPVEGEGQRDDEDRQPVRRLQRHAAIVGLEEAGPKADLTGKLETQMYLLAEREKKLAECKAATPDPILCKPATSPGWEDFTGTPAAGSTFGAATFSSIETVNVPSQKCEQSITGFAAGPLKRFQGVFTPNKSWVKPQFGAAAADPTKNGSAAKIAECEAFFNSMTAGQTGSWHLTPGALPGCPASAQARGDRATQLADCATIVAADFNDRAVAESMRLLKHEQAHLALTCAMAKKGNDALDAGKTFDAIDAVIHSKLATAQSQYDSQSQHGCVASQQAAWESKIAAGLPDIKLP